MDTVSKSMDFLAVHWRAFLCPYYFISGGKANLLGALATVCPPDKKLLHGMGDAILVPTSVAE